jgi:hypothetical protein
MEDLKKLDLYSDLVSMPKYSADASETSSRTLSKKELGRMKSKQAVLAAKKPKGM